MPKLVTATMTKSLRAGKVFLDWSQNNGSKTTIAPYSLRGREQPTVAAPRTWDEIDDPKLRHLRFDEVLERVASDGDLLGRLDDAGAPVPDRLTTYRSMRDAAKTPEPVPKSKPTGGQQRQVRHPGAPRPSAALRLPAGARRRAGVAGRCPRTCPTRPSVNHLAVHTEDHPLEYLTFEGTIPKGEYGAGKVIVWDTGTYETEKFRDNPPDGPEKGGEVIVTLHGNRIDGRYALIQTDGKNWLAHRMKDQKRPRLQATSRRCWPPKARWQKLKKTQWAFEGKWDGYRLLVDADHGKLCVAVPARPRRHRRIPAIQGAGSRSRRSPRDPRRRGGGARRVGRAQLRRDAEPGRARPASSSGRSTSCISTADRCCAPSIPTAGVCWKRWPRAGD